VQGGEKWPGRVSSLDGVRWRGYKGESRGKKRGGCGRSRRLTTPTLSALRLRVTGAAARASQGLFRKNPKTRAIPLRLGQTLLGFRAVRSYRKSPLTKKVVSFLSFSHSGLYQHRKRCYDYDNIIYKKEKKKRGERKLFQDLSVLCFRLVCVIVRFPFRESL